MTSNNQLLIDRDSNNFLINYNKNGKETVFQEQGEKYNRLQKKNAKNVRNNILREGYTSLFDYNTLENTTNNSKVSNGVLTASGISSSDQSTLTSLESQYNSIITEIKTLENKINSTIKDYSQHITQGNPNANQNVVFKNKQSAYVTNAGYAKIFNKNSHFTRTAGNNNCPATSSINTLNMNASGSLGDIMSTNPFLVMGSPMVPGQSCGYEGQNVYVDSILPTNTVPSFVGCYGGNNQKTPLMNILGGNPGTNTLNILQNGNFSQPALPKETYEFYNDNTSLIGWSSQGGGISNSSSSFGFPMPYPMGSQALIIMKQYSVSQIVTLNTGIFNLQFLTAGSSAFGANPILITLTPSSPVASSDSMTIVQFKPSTSEWQQYPSSSSPTSFTITNPGNYILSIIGTGSSQATAFQMMAITDVSTGSVNQNYSFQDCEQAAINGGYQYFSLSNVNETTGLGYCGVSKTGAVDTNMYPANPSVVSEVKALWSSETSNTKANYLVVGVELTNTGELQLFDASGVSRAAFAGYESTGFVGCYKDKGFPDWQRSMTSALDVCGNLINVDQSWLGGSKKYSRNHDYESCSSAAEANNFKYFGLQWNNGEEKQQSECFLSNDLGRTRQYGVSNKCWDVGGNKVGGGWANAVYSTNQPTDSPFYLIVQDDGNICIYKGTDPGNNQGLVWQTKTNSQQLNGDPNHTAKMGKNGRNYLKSGELMERGDFIGNTEGTVYLILQEDGNLVAYTSVTTGACSKSPINNNNTVAAAGNYAMYDLGGVGYPSKLGKLAYIDVNGTLMEYPKSMLNYNSNQFTIIPDTDSSGHNIGKPLVNITLQNVQVLCSETPNCVGFVYDRSTNTGYLKSKIVKRNSLTMSHTRDTYLTIPSISNLPKGVSPIINNVSSILYQNYPKGATMSATYTPDWISKLNNVQQVQLSQLYDSLNLVANQIASFIEQLKQRGIDVSNQVVKNNSFINSGALQVDEVKDKISRETIKDLEVYNQMLNDNQMLTVAQNYTYMIWTIIALGVVIVTVNASR